MEIFGLKIGKSKEDAKKGLTFVAPSGDDGALEIEVNDNTSNYSASIGYDYDLDKIPDDESELLMLYRHLSIQQEVDEAIQEIINEAIISDDLKPSVDLVLDNVDLSENLKTKIRDEFDNILKMIDFKNKGYSMFRKWYIDGRIFFHKVVDKNNLTKGIQDIISIPPENIRMVREVKTKKGSDNLNDVPIYDLKDINEYFLYSKVPFSEKKNTSSRQSQGIKIPSESITYAPSGILNPNGKIVLSYLYKAIKPFNNLKLLEDSVVIYRVTRAPERRIFYVDVGNLPKGKAEQYLKDVMNRFRNKIVYDVNKGTINNRKKFQSMIEDYWLPRREGGRGTEVTTLPGGEQLGELSDVEYFKTKLYKSLNVPISRFQQDSVAFNIGRTSEITRDEIKFSKFIGRLRKRFASIFDDLLKTQLILTKVITSEEWEEIKQDISYTFLEDNYFAELKEVELMNERVRMLSDLENSGAVGKYYSHNYVRLNVLKQSEDEIKEMDKEIEEEMSNERFYPKEDER